MTRILSAGGASMVLLVTLAACTTEGSSPRLAENEIAAMTLMSVWESGDTETLATLFRGDAVYDDFPNQFQYQGLEEIAGYISHVHDWADGTSLSISAIHTSETGAVVEWVFSAAQDRPIGSLVPVATGREVLLNGVTMLEMEDGRIRRAADYFDMLPLMLQIGAEVHLPGGSLLKLDFPSLDETPMDDPVGAP